MTSRLRIAREWLARSSNQIALSTALRGMIATATPLVVLSPLGHIELAHFAVLGAIGISLVDVGGPYRRRLVAMAVGAVLGPSLMMIGLAAGTNWILAGTVMAGIAIGSGLVRAFGPGGVSFGINMSIAFLIGTGAAAFGGGDIRTWSGGYLAGAVWTILVTLAFWQARPYRRLEQEVAGAWQAVADLVAAVRPEPANAASTAATRRRREQTIVLRHRAAREAIERAHDVLGEARAEIAGPGTTMAHLVVLVVAASRVGVAALTLAETVRADDRDAASLSALAAVVGRLERAAHAVAAALLGGEAEMDIEALHQSLPAMPGPDGPLGPAALAVAQAVRNLANAEDALRFLASRRPRFLQRLKLPLGGAPGSGLADPMRRHVNLKSLIFRHALRVAAVVVPCTAVIVKFNLLHGIWLPMTTLIVLQPEYGGTLQRALQRSAGTVAGAVIAGILLTTLHNTAAFEVAVAILLFATFFLIRRHYGQAIAFLTPLLILLVGFSGADPWRDVGDRVLYTLVGAILAIVAGYVLWPRWEHEQLPTRIATALRAGRVYASAVLASLAETAAPESLAPLRRAAEVEATNVEAALERMVAEPSRQRGRVGRLFMLSIYVHRLCRHAIALNTQIGSPRLPTDIVAPLRQLVAECLDDVATALLQDRAPRPRPPFDAPLARVRAAIRESDASSGMDRLIDQIVSDVTALNAAAAAFANATFPAAA